MALGKLDDIFDMTGEAVQVGPMKDEEGNPTESGMDMEGADKRMAAHEARE